MRALARRVAVSSARGRGEAGRRRYPMPRSDCQRPRRIEDYDAPRTRTRYMSEHHVLFVTGVAAALVADAARLPPRARSVPETLAHPRLVGRAGIVASVARRDET